MSFCKVFGDIANANIIIDIIAIIFSFIFVFYLAPYIFSPYKKLTIYYHTKEKVTRFMGIFYNKNYVFVGAI